mgnify:CR=1 FL=1
MIRVLLADDHIIVRAGLRRIIEDTPDMAVAAEAADGQERGRELQKELADFQRERARIEELMRRAPVMTASR